MLEFDFSELRELVDSCQMILGPEGIKSTLMRIAERAKTRLQELTPVKTGQARDNWVIESNGDSIVISNSTKQMAFLEMGTSDHDIHAIGNCLHWNDGGDVFAKWVHVKGIKARHIVENFVNNELENIIDEELIAQLDKIV